MPPLLLLTGSGSNAKKSSVYALQMSSLCGQIKVELFLTFLANFPVGSLIQTQ
jgi:hypothetical protein